MMLDLSPGWTIDVDRGPDWLFVRLSPERPSVPDNAAIAEPLWQLMQQHFAHRIVLELDDVLMMHSWLVGELIRLHKRVESQAGLMRLCGLSDINQQVLKSLSIADRFPQYDTREAAVMGNRPMQPR